MILYDAIHGLNFGKGRNAMDALVKSKGSYILKNQEELSTWELGHKAKCKYGTN